jgi:hypothetical protein
MAYGLTATSVLLSLGVAPVTASASVHAAEVATTGVSALSHWRFGNIDRALLRRLALPGTAGGAIGAYLLTAVPGQAIQPVVSLYLAVMGIVVLVRAVRRTPPPHAPPRRVAVLGLVGGFLDAVGGGGWGPIVTSSLVGSGMSARFAVGTVNAAEFLVTLTISAMFVLTVGLELWPVILGLILGGVIAAPFAAYAVSRVPDRPMRILVGLLITGLSLHGLARALLP